MSAFDLTTSGSHFSYVPYSTFPGDYSLNQWFNNSVVRDMPPGNKTAQKEYLESVVVPAPVVAGSEPGNLFLSLEPLNFVYIDFLFQFLLTDIEIFSSI